MEPIEDILRLAACPGLGPRTYARLREAFGTADAILGQSAAALRAVDGIRAPLADAIARSGDYDPRPELDRAAEEGVSILGQGDPAYPASLRETFDPPIVLYVKGELVPEDAIGLAIVGTRRTSQYGRAQAERFASLLARAGFTVVSGLARGVDSAAHRGALVAGGRTLAVLGSGLARIYPPENRDLAAEITGAGALVSEFAMDADPSRENFPRRNRLIAGLTLGTLVIEAPLRSGALITARLANELGREVFAIPGRIDQRNAEGCNRFISEGQAKLVQSLDDILEEFQDVADALRGAPPPVRQARLPGADDAGTEATEADDAAGIADADDGDEDAPAPAADDRESRILAVIADEEMHIDEICARSGLPVHEVSATLMLLELKRRIEQQPGRFFVRTGN